MTFAIGRVIVWQPAAPFGVIDAGSAVRGHRARSVLHRAADADVYVALLSNTGSFPRTP